MSLVFSEVAEIALIDVRLEQFQQLLKTCVILILSFTRPHAITYTKKLMMAKLPPCHSGLYYVPDI